MILCICSTPLQIMNIVNLATTILQNKKIDLIVLDHAKNNIKYYKQLHDLHIFNNIQYIRTKHMTGGNSEYKIIRYIKAAKHFLNYKEIINQLNNKYYDYDEIIISSFDIPSQIIYSFFKKKNYSLKLFAMEEGLFTYSICDFRYSVIKKLFLICLLKEYFLNNLIGAYIYKPDYMDDNSNLKLTKIPFIDKNDANRKKMFNKIFCYDCYELPFDNYRFIYFDQEFQFDSINNSINNLVYILEKELLSVNNKLLVKLHPRTCNKVFNKDTKIINTSSFFELINLNNEIKEKVLISVFSSACLNPKIMFNEEPYVILLYKLIDLSLMTNFNKSTFMIAEKVKNSYQNKNRFFIPETIEELQDTIHKIIKD